MPQFGCFLTRSCAAILTSYEERRLLLNLKWLAKAKREALLRHLRDAVDQIADAAEDSDQLGVDALLAAFIGGAHVPSGYSALEQNFYGSPLSPSEHARWQDFARLAARCIPQGDEEHEDGAADIQVSVRPVVYIVSVGDENMVKIGFTKSIKSRLRALRTASPLEPIIHLMIDGTAELEAELHRRFEVDRVKREWFRFSEQIRHFIASQKSADRGPNW